jgi:hypothetical protein
MYRGIARGYRSRPDLGIQIYDLVVTAAVAVATVSVDAVASVVVGVHAIVSVGAWPGIRPGPDL